MVALAFNYSLYTQVNMWIIAFLLLYFLLSKRKLTPLTAMKVKTMTPVIDDLCALHFTIPDILLCTDESRIKLDVSGVDNPRLRQIILVISSLNFS